MFASHVSLLNQCMATRLACCIVFICTVTATHALEIGTTEAGSTSTGATTAKSASASNSAAPSAGIWAAPDAVLAQLWSLSLAEIQRARALMHGPRASFSSPQLSPIEVLGIHARNEGERERYARQFARVTYDDTQRVLAWSRVAEAELQALAAGQPVLNYDNAPRAVAAVEAADILGIPRTAVIPAARRVSTPVKPQPGINRVMGRAADNGGRKGTVAGVSTYSKAATAAQGTR